MPREPDFTQRVINGLFGGFLGAVLAFLAAFYFESLVIPFVIVGASVCFLAAFFHGEKAIEWIIDLGRFS